MGILKAIWRVIGDLFEIAVVLYVLHWVLFCLYWAYRTILRGDDSRYTTHAIFGGRWFNSNQGTDWIKVIAKKLRRQERK